MMTASQWKEKSKMSVRDQLYVMQNHLLSEIERLGYEKYKNVPFPKEDMADIKNELAMIMSWMGRIIVSIDESTKLNIIDNTCLHVTPNDRRT